MRDSKGFDLWAEEYDDCVRKTEESGKYPFAGYKKILNNIFNIILETPNLKILDIGFGTAPISSVLYEKGYEIWGQDFSKKMLEVAQNKMPEAHLFLKDFSEGLDSKIKENKFDFIIATYCLHHILDNSQRVEFIKDMLKLLAKSGKLLIGDVMFQNMIEREECKKDAKEEWDDMENYIIIDQIKEIFPNIKFEKYSYCAGLLSIEN